MEHFVLIFRLSTFFCILFSTFYFIQLHYFIIILVFFFLHTHFQCPLHPLPISIKFPPPTPKVTWKPGYFSLFWFWCSHFTNTTCIETLHRPICLFFLISEYNFFFKMSFKQSARASHIRPTMHFVVLLIKSTSDLVRYVLSLFLYTSSTSLGREFPACIRSSLCRRFWCANASLVPLVRARVCMFEIYMAFTCCWCLFRSGL